MKHRYGDQSLIDPNDPIWEQLNIIAVDAKKDPILWIGIKDIYGSLSENKLFCSLFVKWFLLIEKIGLIKTIEQYLKETQL